MQVLARYEDLPDRPPAVIQTRLGRGTVLLSGVHFEVSGAGAAGAGTRQEVVDTLQQAEPARQQFLNTMLSTFLQQQ